MCWSAIDNATESMSSHTVRQYRRGCRQEIHPPSPLLPRRIDQLASDHSPDPTRERYEKAKQSRTRISTCGYPILSLVLHPFSLSLFSNCSFCAWSPNCVHCCSCSHQQLTLLESEDRRVGALENIDEVGFVNGGVRDWVEVMSSETSHSCDSSCWRCWSQRCWCCCCGGTIFHLSRSILSGLTGIQETAELAGQVYDVVGSSFCVSISWLGWCSAIGPLLSHRHKLSRKSLSEVLNLLRVLVLGVHCLCCCDVRCLFSGCNDGWGDKWERRVTKKGTCFASHYKAWLGTVYFSAPTLSLPSILFHTALKLIIPRPLHDFSMNPLEEQNVFFPFSHPPSALHTPFLRPTTSLFRLNCDNPFTTTYRVLACWFIHVLFGKKKRFRYVGVGVGVWLSLAGSSE